MDALSVLMHCPYILSNSLHRYDAKTYIASYLLAI